ncbi:MAG: hypothetical protein ABIE70_01795 [bacterium]
MTDKPNHTIKNIDGRKMRKSGFGLLMGVALTGTAAIVVVLILVSNFYTVPENDLVLQGINAPLPQEMLDLRIREQETLAGYKLLDSATGRYQIPIERAMELVIQNAQ